MMRVLIGSVSLDAMKVLIDIAQLPSGLLRCPLADDGKPRSIGHAEHVILYRTIRDRLVVYPM